MGILASIPLARKFLLAVAMLFFGVFVLGMSFSSTKGKLSPITYPGQDAQKPFAKLMTSQMVPGNPLYLVLMARDRVELTLITDPVQNAWKRAELADARMQTSIVLIHSGEVELGINTMSKAEQYLATAADLLRANDPSQLVKLEAVMIEHHEIMTELKQNINDADKSHLDQVLDFNTIMIQKITPR
ncbi:MAG TPA: DUF5667 domain-containing protein [Candidatus Saccharimonadia bacterium]|nr:DUF5667 domain-containing protein [Candidatus Saccharimonadia bacterium]